MTGEFSVDVPVRYADRDTYGHVNNAVYATYLEEARTAYLGRVLGEDVARAVTGTDSTAAGIVLASLSIEFHRTVGAADRVTVGVTVPELGRTSFPMEYEVRTDEEACATGETTVVHYDREAGTPRPLPQAWRERIAAFEDHPDESPA